LDPDDFLEPFIHLHPGAVIGVAIVFVGVNFVGNNVMEPIVGTTDAPAEAIIDGPAKERTVEAAHTGKIGSH